MKCKTFFIITISFLIIPTLLIVSLLSGCGESLNDTSDSIYKEKVTVTFTDTTQVFHGSNVRFSTGGIYIYDCREVKNNTLIIEFYNVKYYYREDI